MPRNSPEKRKDPVKGRKLFSHENPDKVAWLTRGQLHPEAHEEAENSFRLAAARRLAELSPEERARLADQEKATNAFVNQRLKKESTMRTLTRVVLEAKRNSSGRKAQAKYARKHPDSDVAKRVAARAHGAKPNSAGLENDFIGRFRPKEGQHARHQQTGMTAKERENDRILDDLDNYGKGKVKARQSVRRGEKVSRMTDDEADNTFVKRGRANKPPRKRRQKVDRGGMYDNTAYPLTADRIFMFEGSTKNMQAAADAGNKYAKARMKAKKLGRKAAKQLAKDQHWGRAQATSEKGEKAAAKANLMINPTPDDSYNQRSDAIAANRKTKTGERDPRGARRQRLRTMKVEQRVDEISAEKYDAMSGKERSDYAAKVSRRYRRMADAKKAKDKNFTPDKDLSRPLSAHREIKDRAYARAGRHAELKKLRARRKQPIRRAGMGGRDRGEEMAREAGDRP